MKVIVGCEESGKVTKALRDRGIEAISVDILPTRGNPDWHIQADLFMVLHYYHFDAGIFFPPCTHLSVSGAKHFARKKESGEQQQGIDFFMRIANLKIPYWIENPVGIMSTVWRKPDQYIYPWDHGHKACKKTCIWANDMPLIMPTNIVGPPKKYKDMTKYELDEWTKIHRCAPGPLRAQIRSETYDGIAQAMAITMLKKRFY